MNGNVPLITLEDTTVTDWEIYSTDKYIYTQVVVVVSDSMNVKCKHCDYEWEYNGKFKVNASCPDCLKKTPILNGDVCDEANLR